MQNPEKLTAMRLRVKQAEDKREAIKNAANKLVANYEPIVSAK